MRALDRLAAFGLAGCFPMPVGPVTEAVPLASWHGEPALVCIVYESEGQVGEHTRTRSGMPDETVLVEVLGAREIPCSQAAQAPEAHCRRVPAGDWREEGGGRAWVLLSEAVDCPGRAG